MGDVVNPAEVTARYVDKMGITLGEAFTIIHNEVLWLHAKWGDYRYLFGDAKQIEVLNNTAGPFFHDLRIWMHESIVLHIRRLADPPKSAGKKNLSLKGFGELLREHGDGSCCAEFETALEAVDRTTEFAKEWRNKRIAHMPLPAFAGGENVILPFAGIEDIAPAAQSIGEAASCIHRHYIHGEICWGGPTDLSVGVTSLMYYLRKGLEARRAEDAARLH